VHRGEIRHAAIKKVFLRKRPGAARDSYLRERLDVVRCTQDVSIIEDDGQPDPPTHRPRPWWFAASLVGVAVGGLVGVALLSPPTSRAPSQVVASTAGFVYVVRSPQPTRTPLVRPSDLPLLPEEQAVIDGLKTIGVSAEGLGYSHFERALGPALPARVFTLGEYGGADVLFLDAPRDVRVCASAGNQGRLVYKIDVNGQEASSLDAGQYVAYLVSRQFFVIAWDERAASMFQLAFRDMTRAPC